MKAEHTETDSKLENFKMQFAFEDGLQKAQAFPDSLPDPTLDAAHQDPIIQQPIPLLMHLKAMLTFRGSGCAIAMVLANRYKQTVILARTPSFLNPPSLNCPTTMRGADKETCCHVALPPNAPAW